MLKNVLKMPRWFLLFFIAANSIHVSVCLVDLFYIVNNSTSPVNRDFPVFNTIEAIAETNLTVECKFGIVYEYANGHDTYYNEPHLIWGKRSKTFRFKNVLDLTRMAYRGNHYLMKLHNESFPYDESKALLSFTPIKLADHGTYFCMYLKYYMFKIVHVKVKEQEKNSMLSSSCKLDKFKCIKSGHCINLHYKCDGKNDCLDGSDEDPEICNGDPCLGKIRCNDGRCIPTVWCCDKWSDDNCTVDVRPTCCPTLIDPHDPILWYYNQTNVKELNTSNGSRYLFISVCAISAVLTFALVVFVISKLCGFDKEPPHSRSRSRSRSRNYRNNRSGINQTTSFTEFNRCEHSECAIRRQFNPILNCLYLSNSNNTSTSNNSELADPLIANRNNRTNLPIDISDQPPSYDEVVTAIADKGSISDLINAPPPPYSSTKFNISETEDNRGGSNLNTLNDADDNYRNNQNVNCDIVRNGDLNVNVVVNL